ncbi:MAG: peptidase M1 [Acidobacteria bacterium]|nr:MAG: peptidase M1 [Acidobacteriota bacterium]
MSLFRRTLAPARVPPCFTRLLVLGACILAISAPLSAAERSRIQVNDYLIDADLTPKTHHLTAKAKVKFTALDNISTAVFELNNALRVTRVTNEAGKTMPTERVTQDYTIRVSLPEGLSKAQSQTLTFDYEGVLDKADDSPVEGLKLASIGPDTTYLLYPARWFPMVGLKIYFKPNHKDLARSYAETAAKELAFFSSIYGPISTANMSIVELPDDTVPAAWTPQLAGITSKAISDKVNYRLLANTLAHQWWGASVSPAAKDDFWITEGAARDSEVRYVQDAAGEAGFEEACKDMAVGALAYDNIPLSGVAKLDPFSPEFQSLVTDKGGMIFHMLRWQLGDANYDRTMKSLAQQYAGKSVSTDQFRELSEQNAGQKLGAFFTQWLDGTGAPEFKNKYTTYRLGNNKGFRIVGQINQDLDLFRMPLEVRVDTDGKSEMKRIDVVGTESTYSVETFGKPRRIILDPNNWVLKNSPDLRVRVAILRGQQLVAQGDLAEALKEYQKALDANHNSSLAHYRVAEVFFLQKNYQSAANAYREALSGDGEPKWTEVWSHIQLGKIFDITDQRERATNEYRQALQTNDNTQGALDEARRYLNQPYKREREAVG